MPPSKLYRGCRDDDFSKFDNTSFENQFSETVLSIMKGQDDLMGKYEDYISDILPSFRDAVEFIS